MDKHICTNEDNDADETVTNYQALNLARVTVLNVDNKTVYCMW